jgi:hypothetical protein
LNRTKLDDVKAVLKEISSFRKELAVGMEIFIFLVCFTLILLGIALG